MQPHVIAVFAFALSLLAVIVPAAEAPLFDLEPLADGVYAAVARPRTPINGNALVVVYDEGVLVAGRASGAKPSSRPPRRHRRWEVPRKHERRC